MRLLLKEAFVQICVLRNTSEHTSEDFSYDVVNWCVLQKHSYFKFDILHGSHNCSVRDFCLLMQSSHCGYFNCILDMPEKEVIRKARKKYMLQHLCSNRSIVS